MANKNKERLRVLADALAGGGAIFHVELRATTAWLDALEPVLVEVAWFQPCNLHPLLDNQASVKVVLVLSGIPPVGEKNVRANWKDLLELLGHHGVPRLLSQISAHCLNSPTNLKSSNTP